MNQNAVDQIVEAVLYEGYMLYPYRPSVKNQQRWSFGGLYPEEYCQHDADRYCNQTECLIQGSSDTTIDIIVRFLHVTERTGGLHGAPWQEAEERTVRLPPWTLAAASSQDCITTFAFPARRWEEPATGADAAAISCRRQEAIEGAIAVQASAVGGGYKLRVQVHNTLHLPKVDGMSRDEVLLRSLVSTHTILNVRGGEFVSLLDPPAEWREAAAACVNVGTWPVLVGDEGARDTMLSSPIILYDYPRTAPESPGNLFDGTEIDEILTLRIMTLTDDEKRQAAAMDDRVRDLLVRTEAVAREQLGRLHGTFRPIHGPEKRTHDGVES